MCLGTLAPNVFAQSSGQILLHGVESNNLAAVLESHGARHNNNSRGLRMNKQDSSEGCIVGVGEQYSNSNPASVYIQFVRAHADIVRMLTTHEYNLKAERRARVLRAQAVKLQEEEEGGVEAPADEQEAMSEVLKRREDQQVVRRRRRSAARTSSRVANASSPEWLTSRGQGAPTATSRLNNLA